MSMHQIEALFVEKGGRGFRSFPRIPVFALLSPNFPERVNFTPDTCLIFINQIREGMGV